MQCTNLAEVLIEKKEMRGSGITFIEGSDRERFLSYRELYDHSLGVLAFLQSKGIRSKEELVFQVEDNRTFIITFWACMLGGIIPVPLTPGKTDDQKEKLFAIWPVLNRPWLIISRDHLERLGEFALQKAHKALYDTMVGRAIDESDLFSSENGGEMEKTGEISDIAEDDIAFIQFSSGSTGSPKGVILTHKNLLTNIRAISKAARYSTADSMISWMPLTHDMGLIGFHLNPLFIGMDHFLMPSSAFIRKPSLWLEKASQHRITILSSPNFGYEYLIKQYNPTDARSWDLSHIRIIFNGAEPISKKLCREFLDIFAKYGLKNQSLCPVYGLAEASLAVSISGLDDEVISVDVDRNKLNVGDRISVQTGRSDSLSFVNTGKPIDHCSVSICDNKDIPVPHRTIGHIRIKGDNVTSGYYNNAGETRKAITKDGWLRTGDIGFIKDHALYITGRAKDIIFVNGQNYYPHDMERVAEEVGGIHLNKIAFTGFFNHQSGKDEIIAFFCHRGDVEDSIPVMKAVRSLINRRFGLNIDRMIPVKSIPRTTSGKLQRFKLLDRFKNGDFDSIILKVSKLLEERTVRETFPSGPGRDTEQKIWEIWKRILGDNTIGITQRFFETGGNSLKAAELSANLLKEFQVHLPMEVIYEKQTIRELAGEIDACQGQELIPIPVIRDRQHYPASPAQKRLYYFWKLDKSSIVYNIPIACKIDGDIKTGDLEESIRKLIRRHDSLRMTFQMQEEPAFILHEYTGFSLPVTECHSTGLNKKLKNLVRPFDLDRGPLFRLELLKVNDTESVLFMDFHHIISDGGSIYNFITELLTLYEGNELPFLPIQYKDYSCWKETGLQQENIMLQQQYWLDRLKEEPPVLELPRDFQRPVIFNHEGEKIECNLDGETTKKLRQLAKESQCTLHVVLFTLYNILLSRYSGQPDLIIGIPVAGRGHPDLQHMQGMFVNTLAIRSRILEDETFARFLQRQRNNIAEAFRNQDYPLYDLTHALIEHRDVSRNPVFDTMFIYQDMGVPKVKTAGITIGRHFFDPGFSKFDISLEVFEEENSMTYYFEYATSLFKRERILGMAAHFENLINRVIYDPGGKIAELPVISDNEFDEYIHKFNTTGMAWPVDGTIHRLFGTQVKNTPDNVAVEYRDEKLTYRELNDRANRFAARLKERGLTPNGIAAILLERSPGLIISILAVLKAGGAYVPVDTELPGERVRYILTDSQCKIVITDTSNKSLITGWQIGPPDGGPSIIDIGQQDPVPARYPQLPDSPDLLDYPDLPDKNTSHDLAYVIYTSGTTGAPKGVMIEHRSLVNYIWWAAQRYVKNEKVTFPLYSSISFDLTVTSVFTPLITGNKILIYEEDGIGSPIERVIADNKSDIIKLTPSHLKIVASGKLPVSATEIKIKRFIVGGEQLDTRLAAEVFEKFEGNVEILNEYGPTEATVGCMIHAFDPEDANPSVPIGVPAANTRIYLLDKFLKPVPAGVNGELYIAGEGLARGYLFKDELTVQKFIPDPFFKGQRMYATGDTARRLSDGTLAFIGRSDRQVKVNGYRIELTEIERRIMSYNGVKEALVTYRTDKKNNANLYAYYRSKEAIGESLLRGYLADRLPHYMIPVRFTRLEVIPLTPNGKLDYNALPGVDKHTGSKEHTGAKEHAAVEDHTGMEEASLPGNEIEIISLKIWKEVLAEPALHVTDNFFEMGGDSIKAIQIVSKLVEKGIVLKPRDILTHHTIRQISLHAEIARTGEKYAQHDMAGEREPTPVESWFFSQELGNPNYYNQSILLTLNREADPGLLQEAFRRVIRHHDGLRINFDPVRKKMFYNKDHLGEDFRIEERPAHAPAFTGLKNGFDITKSLLIRAAILKESESVRSLFITAHHLVIDGVSWRILLEDLYTVYTALEQQQSVQFPRKTATLMDWERKLAEYASFVWKSGQAAYWDSIENIAFSIPLDFETTDWKVRNRHKVQAVLSREKTEFLIKEAYRPYRTDPSILLNTALALTLRKWTGSDRIIIEQENHGRHLGTIDVSRTVGWFTAIYPIQLECRDGAIGDQIKAVKECIRKVPDQGIGYGLRKYFGKPANNSPGKLTEVRLNYLGQFDRELNTQLFAYDHRSTGSDTDPDNLMTARLEINAMIIYGELNIEMNYNARAHQELTIRWLKDEYLHHLEMVLEHIKSEDNIHFTPSDFDTVDLDEGELNELFT